MFFARSTWQPSQRRFAPQSDWQDRNHTGSARSGYDFDEVTTKIHRLHGKGKVAEKYWAYMEARAEALVDQYWHFIENVAKALLEHGSITGDLRRFFTRPDPKATRTTAMI